MMRTLRLLLVMGAVLASLSAQDDVLAVERREDVRGRDALVRVLQAARAEFRVEAATPKELCRLFAARLGDKVNFCVGGKDEGRGIAATFALRQASVWSAMAVAQEQTGLRFVYRAGVVFLVPKEAIKPLTYVVVYDLRAEVTPLRDHPGPELRLPDGNDDRPRFPPAEDSGTTVSGFTADGIEAMLKEQVTPEQWGTEAASMTNTKGLFVVRHSAAGHAKVRELLVALGLR